MTKLPVTKLIALIPKLVDAAHAAYDIAVKVHSHQLTPEQAHADAQVIWEGVWTTILALAAH